MGFQFHSNYLLVSQYCKICAHERSPGRSTIVEVHNNINKQLRTVQKHLKTVQKSIGKHIILNFKITTCCDLHTSYRKFSDVDSYVRVHMVDGFH